MDNMLTFQDLNLKDEIIQAIDDLGFEEPTPIQKAAIPIMMTGEDIIGQAQTGTGKTAAFGIPILNSLSPESRNPQALILTPTRELAIQITDELRKFSKYLPGIRSLAIYGGQPIERQIKALRTGVQIIAGTPGRLLDHIRRKTIKLSDVKIVVLDEADQMLDMGFLEDIESILNETPAQRQTVLFSATIPREIREIAKNYQKDPKTVKVVHEKLTVPLVEQFYYEVRPNEKLEVLCRLLDMEKEGLGVIFCKTKKGVDELVESLQSRGYFAEAIHGDLKQVQRDRVMKKFREGTIELLIATDVAARGIDVENITMVINYDIPEDLEYYVHRIGRTARAGKTGVSYTFVTGRQINLLKNIEHFTKSKIKRKKIPTLIDLAERQREMFKQRIISTIEAGHLGAYQSMVEMISEEYSSIDVAAALAKLIMEKERVGIVEEATDKFDIRDEHDSKSEAEAGMVRIFLSVGKRDHVRVGDILGAIANEGKIPGKKIGNIEMFDKYTFVQVPEDIADKVLKRITKMRIKGKKVNAELESSR